MFLQVLGGVRQTAVGRLRTRRTRRTPRAVARVWWRCRNGTRPARRRADCLGSI